MSNTAMYTAVSGLRNQQVYMDVIANNISNSGTTGYKRGRLTFEESFSQLLAGAYRPPGEAGGVNPLQVGNGTSIGSIDTILNQGPIQATGNLTDMAIQGDGFFTVSEGNEIRYTRSGAFQWDSNGKLVLPFNGMKVQGRMADEEGVIPEGAPMSDIQIKFGLIDRAQETDNVTFIGNLDSEAEPTGNVLKTDRLYAREIAGDTSDVNFLYARGNADRQISGMSPLSTTVTVTIDDQVQGEVTESFTYVEEDAGVGTRDFNTIDQLLEEINTEFEDYVNATLNANGAIEFANLGDANNTINLSSVNSVFHLALASANGVVGDNTTDEFSHVAKEADLMVDLRNANGENLGLEVDDVVTVNANIGGDPIPTGTINVDTGAGNSITYGQYAQQLKDIFELTNTEGVEIDDTEGNLIINADGGQAYEITALNITTNADEGEATEVFDDVFDGTVENWTEVQEAEDVTHSTPIRVYDSLGHEHTLSITFTKDPTKQATWDWKIDVPEPAISSGGDSGTVNFDAYGRLESFKYANDAKGFTFDPQTGAEVPVEVVFDFGTIGQDDGLTHYANNSTAIAKDQDGYPQGVLDSVSVDKDGKITGQFTNGNTRTLAKIVIATFNNPAGLLRQGDNTYQVSSNSGLPIYGYAGKEFQTEITPGALEMANVDVAEEFTNMIMAQRTFQANARTVTTSDEMMQEVVNLKR